MTDYFVGIGGNDGNTGLSWAQRFLTLNAAEDEPVAANDTVYVGPGVYREQLTVDVSGSSGQPITYIGDITGEATDGVGGIVRVTGSDDDQTATRASCIDAASKNYRTFRGFTVDSGTVQLMNFLSCDDIVIEDCHFGDVPDDQDIGIYFNLPAATALITVRRCVFSISGPSIYLNGASEIALDSSSIIENCIFLGSGHTAAYGIRANYIASFTVKNCIFLGVYYGIRSFQSITGTISVNNSIFINCNIALYASSVGDIIEDYNNVNFSNTTPRSSVSTGSNSNNYPPLIEMPMLLDGIQFPWNVMALSKWSQLARIAGSGEATDDLYGQVRPTTSAKKSWGAVQYQPGTRETGTTRGSSTASIALADAGRHQIFVPVTGVSTTISIYVNREANYAGTNPQMIIREPGQADRTTTDAAAVSQWNELTDTFTPSGDVDYVIVELVSNNTAASGSYGTYFDDLGVS